MSNPQVADGGDARCADCLDLLELRRGGGAWVAQQYLAAGLLDELIPRAPRTRRRAEAWEADGRPRVAAQIRRRVERLRDEWEVAG